MQNGADRRLIDVPLGGKLAGIALAGTAALAAVVTLGLTGFRSLEDTIVELRVRDVDGLAEYAAAQSAYLNLRSELRGAIAYQQDETRREALLASSALLRREVLVHLDLGLRSVLSDEGRELSAKARAAFLAYDGRVEQLSAAIRAGEVPLIQQVAGEMQAAGKDTTALLTEMVGRKRKLAEEAQRASQVLVARLRAEMIGLALAAVAIFGALTFLISRSITRPVTRMLRVLGRVAQGDLRERAEVRSADEVGQLSGKLNEALQKMESALLAVRASTHELSSCANKVGELGQDLGGSASRAEDQAVSAARCAGDVSQAASSSAAASEELQASVAEIARNATATAKIASGASEAASAANDSVTRLGASSQQIGQVVKLISGIAEQTNLLALNATIEAARAGEAGKGFAVVATEVKELAKQTAKATEDIGVRVAALQADSAAAVEAIRSIAAIVQQVNGAQSGIAAAVEEQTATTSELARGAAITQKASEAIAAAVAGVRKESQATNSNANQGRDASHDLSRLAAHLEAQLGRFELTADGLSTQRAADEVKALRGFGTAPQWTQALSTGQPLVDQQHKELFFRVGLLHEALQEGKEAAVVSQLIGFLFDYTKTHFAEEEQMLAEAHYEQLPQHQALHRALEAKVQAFRKRADAGERLQASEVSEFTGNWLSEHIAKVDMAYLPALRKAGRVLDLKQAA